MEETQVIVVGAGPAGLATSACLNRLSIQNIVLERDDCSASLWRKRAYDRLKLHLAKNYCNLPYMPFPDNAPTYISRIDFIKYLDEYMSSFGIQPRCCRTVEQAWYEKEEERWKVVVENTSSGEQERYVCRFLVAATGENSEGLLPNIPGLESFNGEVLHSSGYDNGQRFRGKDVLVVGCGNSGMEIAYDLSNHAANTSIVVRSPVHVLTKDIVRLGMFLLKYFPCKVVDSISINLAKLKYGDYSKYGIQRPRAGGPFLIKSKTGRSPTLDVGCMKRIRTGEVKVFPSITCIKRDQVRFAYGIVNCFDAIIFATGYKSTVINWLQDEKKHFNENGMPRERFPNHWKGENGLYCAGFGQQGLFGISNDAQDIATDISLALGLNIAVE